MRQIKSLVVFAGLLVAGLAGCDMQKSSSQLTDAQVENLVKRSYQYVAMYNVNNKFALKLGRWNTCAADAQLKDHTMREIARPNNDTLYITCMPGDSRNAGVRLEVCVADDHGLRPLCEHPDVNGPG